MRKKEHKVVLLLLCPTLFIACVCICLFLTSCGSNHLDIPESGNTVSVLSGEPSNPDTTTQPPAASQNGGTSSLVEPWYDTVNNALTLVDFFSNSTTASYTFDKAQSFTTPVEETKNGFVMLTSPMADNAITSDSVVISGDDTNSDSLTAYCFDKQLHLQNSYTLDDPDLVDCLKNYPLAIAPDGNTLTWVQEDSICHYSLNTGNTTSTPLDLPETVYMIQVRYSASGKYLFYQGDGDNENVILYGALDVATGGGTLFRAKDFNATALEVSGEYAVVEASVPPGKTEGNGHVLIIDAQAGTGQEMNLNHQAENSTAVVSSDGRALVTCEAAADGKSGTLRCYDVASGNLALGQPYSFAVSGWPHRAVFHQQNVYVTLYTTEGPVFASPIALP